MKTPLLLLVLASLVCSSTVAAKCDCTITPYKPDPPCFIECVSKVLASASYGELTGKYGLSDDLSRKIIDARANADISSGWYTRVLSPSDVSHIDAKFSHFRPDSSEKHKELPRF